MAEYKSPLRAAFFPNFNNCPAVSWSTSVICALPVLQNIQANRINLNIKLKSFTGYGITI